VAGVSAEAIARTGPTRGRCAGVDAPDAARPERERARRAGRRARHGDGRARKTGQASRGRRLVVVGDADFASDAYWISSEIAISR
jgi:hypothetical protein